jgi:hypothetical protein
MKKIHKDLQPFLNLNLNLNLSILSLNLNLAILKMRIVNQSPKILKELLTPIDKSIE